MLRLKTLFLVPALAIPLFFATAAEQKADAGGFAIRIGSGFGSYGGFYGGPVRSFRPTYGYSRGYHHRSFGHRGYSPIYRSSRIGFGHPIGPRVNYFSPRVVHPRTFRGYPGHSRVFYSRGFYGFH